jgi:hypothetical protein
MIEVPKKPKVEEFYHLWMVKKFCDFVPKTNARTMHMES